MNNQDFIPSNSIRNFLSHYPAFNILLKKIFVFMEKNI
jgi:hypothetical protein